MTEISEVWIFVGSTARFPSAIFSVREDGIEWIRQHRLTGVFTRYPVDISVHQWAIENGNFTVKSQRDQTPEFIGKFSRAAQEHMHFENGVSD